MVLTEAELLYSGNFPRMDCRRVEAVDLTEAPAADPAAMSSAEVNLLMSGLRVLRRLRSISVPAFPAILNSDFETAKTSADKNSNDLIGREKESICGNGYS